MQTQAGIGVYYMQLRSDTCKLKCHKLTSGLSEERAWAGPDYFKNNIEEGNCVRRNFTWSALYHLSYRGELCLSKVLSNALTAEKLDISFIFVSLKQLSVQCFREVIQDVFEQTAQALFCCGGIPIQLAVIDQKIRWLCLTCLTESH